MVVRIAVVVLLLGVFAAPHPAPAEARADSLWCSHDSYLDLWLAADAIFQARVDSTFRASDGITGYKLDVTRSWKGSVPNVVFADTGSAEEHNPHLYSYRVERLLRNPAWTAGYAPVRNYYYGDGLEVVSQRAEYIIYYNEGHLVRVNDVCRGSHLAEEFAGSELAALRIVHYSLWGITVVVAAVLALILRAAWRRRARA